MFSHDDAITFKLLQLLVKFHGLLTSRSLSSIENYRKTQRSYATRPLKQAFDIERLAVLSVVTTNARVFKIHEVRYHELSGYGGRS